jgi:hypothetical protein
MRGVRIRRGGWRIGTKERCVEIEDRKVAPRVI